MITYLTGATTPTLLAANRADLGVLGQPGNRVERRAPAFGGRMAYDNGCFTKGADFDTEAYLARLAGVVAEGNVPLFATAPDVVGDHVATVRRSVPVLERIRALGVPVAFVAQDGMELDANVRWDAFDVLFIGGSTEWKLGPAVVDLVAEAKRRGKHVHMGRVNSLKRLRYAEAIGCDTADGTYVARGGEKNAAKLLSWLDELHPQLAA